MAQTYLGIGTNLGDKEGNIRRAVELIGRRAGRVLAVSPLYESDPWGFVSENRFANAAVRVDTPLTPEELLAETQRIERDMGRQTKSDGAYTDRIIDIDILLYDMLVTDTETLKIPHPLLPVRDFVVIPLAAIAPGLVHPTLHKRMDELAAAFQ